MCISSEHPSSHLLCIQVSPAPKPIIIAASSITTFECWPIVPSPLYRQNEVSNPVRGDSDQPAALGSVFGIHHLAMEATSSMKSRQGNLYLFPSP